MTVPFLKKVGSHVSNGEVLTLLIFSFLLGFFTWRAYVQNQVNTSYKNSSLKTRGSLLEFALFFPTYLQVKILYGVSFSVSPLREL